MSSHSSSLTVGSGLSAPAKTICWMPGELRMEPASFRWAQRLTFRYSLEHFGEGVILIFCQRFILHTENIAPFFLKIYSAFKCRKPAWNSVIRLIHNAIQRVLFANILFSHKNGSLQNFVTQTFGSVLVQIIFGQILCCREMFQRVKLAFRSCTKPRAVSSLYSYKQVMSISLKHFWT